MKAITSKLATYIWMMLSLATLGTWYLVEQGTIGDNQWEQYIVPIIFLVVFFKVRLVLLYFMELKNAPILWRILFELWALISSALIVIFYLRQGVS